MRKVMAERLRELLRYDPETGFFYWRVNRYTGRPAVVLVASAGQRAGCLMKNGYWYISVDNRRYLASRLAWLYMTGEWPSVEIDHRDTDAENNRWSNLRLATSTLNSANTRRRIDNTSGFKGVSYDRACKKWAASIQMNGHSKYLGRFDSPELAHAAYVSAAQQYFGEFARVA